eukprot:5824619-Amphidinium_carterae.1
MSPLFALQVSQMQAPMASPGVFGDGIAASSDTGASVGASDCAVPQEAAPMLPQNMAGKQLP